MPETRTLMLYRQISHCTVWEQNRTQTLSIGRIYELSKVKTAGTYSNHWALKNIIDHQVTKKHGTVEAYLHALLTLAPLRSSLSTVPTGYNRPASSAVVKTSHVIPPFPHTPSGRVLVDRVWNVMAHTQKSDFVFRRNGRVHLNRPRGVSSVDYWQPRCVHLR